MTTHRTTLQRLHDLITALGPGPWPRQDLLDRGWSPGMLSRAVSSGVLVRERRGLYAPSSDGATQLMLDGDGVHRARLRSIARSIDSSAVVSHSSAAELQGLWLPRSREQRTIVTIPGQAYREDARLVVHGSGLPGTSVEVRDGIAVTDIPRTAVDVARGEDLPHALVIVDSAVREILRSSHPSLDRALRDGRIPSEEVESARQRLECVVAQMIGWPGVRTARAAVAAADPASASPFESWSRGWMSAVELPPPTLNRPVRGVSGRLYYADFLWEEHGVIGEADGGSKYGVEAHDIRAAMRAEKERQADLEAAGWRVVRWMTGDSGALIVSRIGRALYLAPHRSAGAGRRRGA